MNRLLLPLLIALAMLRADAAVAQNDVSLTEVEHANSSSDESYASDVTASQVSDEVRLQNFAEAVIDLHSKTYEPEEVAYFSTVFAEVELLLGNTETFIVVLRDQENLLDIAPQMACEVSPNICDSESSRAQLSQLGVIGDDGQRYKLLKLIDEEQQKQIIFLDHQDQGFNERSQSAISAFVNEFIEDAVGEKAGFPNWWIRGQQEYLYQRLSSSMYLGLPFDGFHNYISGALQGRAENNALLQLLESDYMELGAGSIIKLVNEFSLKSVFIDMYQFGSEVEWATRFQQVFDTSPVSFAEELRKDLINGVDLNNLRDPNDVLDGLWAPWEETTDSISALIDLSPFQMLASVDFTMTDGCPHIILMESHEFGDFNGDGYQDLVFTFDENNSWAQTKERFCSAPTTVLSIQGAAPGILPEVIIVDDQALGARDTVVADINGDGFDDLLVVGAHHKNNESFAEDSPPISGVNLYLGGPDGLKRSTAEIQHNTAFNLSDMTSEFATFGDIDGDSRPEFFLIGTRAGVSFPQPLVIDCENICAVIHPVGFDADTYPSGAWGVSVYNGALVDLDGDGDLDILMNLEVDSTYFDQEPFLDSRFGHAAYYQNEGRFDMSSYPAQVPMGFRLDQNTIAPIPDDGFDRDLPVNATHYWESEVLDLNGDGIAEFVTLENNQFHVMNPRFLVSIYDRVNSSDQFLLSEQQPQDTGATHDQNFNFIDILGDDKPDLLSTLKPNRWYSSNTIALHQNMGTGWRLTTKGFNQFMRENNCNRIYTPDFDADGNIDVVITCPRADTLEIYYARNQRPADRDRDGIPDQQDRYPLIAIGDFKDTDGDGAPDDCDQECLASGMTADPDDDNDGVPDASDAFPLDSSEWVDTDGDGIGNNADPDDDGDGYTDQHELEMGSDPLDPRDIPRSKGLSPAILRVISDGVGVDAGQRQ